MYHLSDVYQSCHLKNKMNEFGPPKTLVVVGDKTKNAHLNFK
jgi:hypothetical protein